jgi:murein L,D-transpeptidase YafK
MNKIIFSFFLLVSFTFANVNLIDTYRKYGINEVEKIINNKLTNKKYWEQILKDKNIQNGYYESLNYVVLCNKNNKDIKVYNTKNNKLLYSSKVIIGKNSGNKIKEGDLKTPIGVYKLIEKLDKLDPFYGPFALESDYPNDFDRSLNKTGHGIWIHGVPYNEKRDPYTKGCIALDNKNLKKLDSSIKIKDSVLIISEKDNLKTTKSDIATILSSIYKWRDSWKYSDFKTYSSFYSKEFKRKNRSTLDKFLAHKKRLFDKKEKKIIRFSNINIIPYPNDLNKNIYQITMDEYYKTATYKYVGKKELFVEIINNKMKILTE